MLQAAAPSKVVTGPSGATVKATGADPNDPALHGLPDQASAKQPIYGTSPHAGMAQIDSAAGRRKHVGSAD